MAPPFVAHISSTDLFSANSRRRARYLLRSSFIWIALVLVCEIYMKLKFLSIINLRLFAFDTTVRHTTLSLGDNWLQCLHFFYNFMSSDITDLLVLDGSRLPVLGNFQLTD